MLIDFFKTANIHHISLYQRITDHKGLTFTSNNNLSLRLGKSQKDKLYADSMLGGEDMYVCLKLLKQNQKYLIDNELNLFHKPRENKRALFKQFYNYGKFGVDALKNLNLSKLEFFYNFNFYSHEHNLVFKIPFFIPGLIYLNFFSLHLLLMIGSIIFWNPYLLYASLCFFLLELLKESGMFYREKLKNSFIIYFIKYLVNMSFSLGALTRLFKNKIIFIPPSLHQSHYLIPPALYIFFKKRDKEIKKLTYDIFNNPHQKRQQLDYLNKYYLRINHQDTTVILRQFKFIFKIYLVTDFYKRK